MRDLSWLEINLANFRDNIQNLKFLLKKPTQLMAVVKSNAYGHGMIECAKMAVGAGADWLGVVNLDEALTLRRSEIGSPILVMGYVEPERISEAAKNNISIAVINFDHLENCLKVLQLYNFTIPLKIHLKIETGISRLGFVEKDWPRLIQELEKLPKNIQIEGIYSHFASVEEYDLAYARKQIEKLLQSKKLFKKNSKHLALCSRPLWHLAASAATMILPESHLDMVRCGIAIYGLWPSAEIQNEFLRNKRTEEQKNRRTIDNETIEQWNSDFLKPVMSYKTRVIQIKEVKRGDYIGYGCTYPVDRPMTIAVIPVGYAEGFDRGFSNPAPAGNKGGEVLIGGQRCPVVGRVCMNMTVVDITHIAYRISHIAIGEEVVLIGKQGNEEITADEWAEKLGTINYEVTTRIPEKIERIYVNG